MSSETGRAKIVVEHDLFHVYLAPKSSLCYSAPLGPQSTDSREVWAEVGAKQSEIQDMDIYFFKSDFI